MDNLTHTVIGAVVAESAVRLWPTVRSLLATPQRRVLATTLAVAGSNLPDADFIYPLLAGGKLDYLLHHRGHTHTLIGAVLGACLLLGLCRLWLHLQRRPVSKTDARWLAGLALAGPLLHLGMDATNNYGVHPFWPFHNAWFYGDTLFIIEPLLWLCATPLVFLWQSRPARGAALGVVLLAVALAFGSGYVPLPMALVLAGLLGVMAAAGRFLSPGTAALSGVVLWLLVLAGFRFAGMVADSRLQRVVALSFADSLLLDRVLTPSPVNPLCWEVILVQQQGDRYMLRRAMLALAPGLLPAATCPGRNLEASTTAPLQPVDRENSAALHWYGEITLSVDALQELVATDCSAAAFMRFGRAPWFLQTDAGWVIGDLRYDREPDAGFAELSLTAEAAPCPGAVPPWTPPRQDLLR